MKTNRRNKEIQETDFSKFTEEELTDAFVFPSEEKLTDEEKKVESDFWAARRIQFKNRTPIQQIYGDLLRLKFQLEDYIGSDQYKEQLNFGYFLNEYVSRQDKKDKEFADEVDVTPAVLSQYINNHRKPKDEFVIRLELHSNGMIPAISWFKVIQKDKEHEIMTNQDLRREESKHVKNRLELVY
ncbi:XRE family transcriptional regulator [Pedobacter chinensis]|uniref:XRE family transcriptional regulator n=1 Tax=Pedobacter chinensis TaxID=2282421 RepID=A0A369PYY2_9SPHI|nr:helix-turn-helix transcriptional regulator [Pedobacter chinensis]RDC55909.1 XRE family transcriptional regulator [Pedobacter chinensis]